ncbi:hypothetical protein [Nonomuraea wenchangensis]|uniref:Winged helix DNA-binding domain-containing protein n=1 Tax=Nonomuraea wenchangensis TaxID=568860 RepID=A0A1I0LU35_9ACTN|nr:hypothetical protein [Nonomuraea wenchangensis]SEU46539.1 hypothetical protein SAMN05421811_12770 [Nonomuraea wenchangensis]
MSRKPSLAQRAVLERCRDEQVWYDYLHPRRSGVGARTFDALFDAGWIAYGGERGSSRLLVLTEAGRAVLDAEDAS